MKNPEIIHYDDIGFSVRYGLCEFSDVVVSFQCYQFSHGKTASDVGEMIPTRFYEGFISPTESLDQAQIFLEADVRFDGCSNIWGGDDGVAWHFCEKDQARNVGVLLGRLYDLAETLLGPLD